MLSKEMLKAGSDPKSVPNDITTESTEGFDYKDSITWINQ